MRASRALSLSSSSRSCGSRFSLWSWSASCSVRALSLVLAWATLPSCPAGPDGPSEPAWKTVEGIKSCDTPNVEANPDARCFTFRAVAGVSMGGGTAGRIGFRHPELWDVVGIMGTPFADNEFFYRMLQENQLGGFCPLEQLESALEAGKTLDEVDDPEVFCGVHDVFPLEGDDQVDPGTFPAVEGTRCSWFRSDYNHWYRGPDAGRGGSFTRNGLFDVVHDLIAAFGNPFYENEFSEYFPPGVPDTWHVIPQAIDDAARRAALCEEPIVVSGLYNREYNPEGRYDAITFCDGNELGGDDADSGNYFPDQRSNQIPVEFLLAIDLNGNRRRDYGEPIVINNQERFEDCGVDGICNGNDGDTDDDDWDPLTNPDGTERNGRLDTNERFDDDGLDGVPATGDFGEGNGSFDRAPALQRLLDDSPGSLMEKMPDAQTARLDVWMDAGIRDFLNTAQTSNALYAQLKRRMATASSYSGFRDLPIDPKYKESTAQYFYYQSDYTRDALGQVAYLRYGDTALCPGSDGNLGDGNHVGAGDVVSRIFTLFSFLSARMPAQGRDASINGLLTDFAPNGSIADFAQMAQYDSDVLDRPVDYGYLLPPDYFLPEAKDRRYPVLYFFHGQGMEASGMVALGLALLGPMKESARLDRMQQGTTDLQRAIIIWVDGNCLGDACYTGNFYADFRGLPRDDRRFESAFYELVRHVEKNYRTKGPELVPLDRIDN
jgi:hypothetical protein